MPATYHGFNEHHKRTVQADLLEAKRFCVVASNSLIVNSDIDINPRPKELLRKVFSLAGSGDDFLDKVNPIKDTFLGFSPRVEQASVRHDSSRPTGDPNSTEFLAFTKTTDDKSIFLRDVYFKRDQRTRALVLVHEYVHLRYPADPPNDHPGGVLALFAETDIGIDYDDAIHNPYCYQYFIDWLV